MILIYSNICFNIPQLCLLFSMSLLDFTIVNEQ